MSTGWRPAGNALILGEWQSAALRELTSHTIYIFWRHQLVCAPTGCWRKGSRIPDKRTLLVVLGFLITLLSTLLSGVFIHQSDRERADLTEQITRIRDVRATGKARMTESVARIDSASILFALAQAPKLESGARKHMIERCKTAVKEALCFKYDAIRALHETITKTEPVTDPPELNITDCEDHNQTLEDFLAIPKGKPSKYEQLIEEDKEYAEYWGDVLAWSREELDQLQKALSDEETWSSLLRSLGTALGLLGLMIVLARDLVG